VGMHGTRVGGGHAMNIRKHDLAAIVGGSVLAGASIGAISFGAGSLSAVAATGTATGSGFRMDTPAASPGVFKPNEDPAHEATESAQREAQENAGQVPTVP